MWIQKKLKLEKPNILQRKEKWMSCQFISFDIGKFKIANKQLPFKGSINEKMPSVIMSLPIAHQPETSVK